VKGYVKEAETNAFQTGRRSKLKGRTAKRRGMNEGRKKGR
jgi:hypothetical protein